ncbi:MAG: hypothetical protein JJ927_12845 [Balneola sp.]|nr:hypothetical protein [Balneola sp.]MBO6651911.1 hypothetical protein [Balneola sp.]MBO6709977.1 hypothetical protein [Balneola sp.]MBO6871868.1 hypothetical protein [Balneola sp.]
MLLRNSKYSFLLALLAVAGLFSSMIHYHSEGLECLEHAEEAHIIQNQDYCPISTLVSDDEFVTTFGFEVLLPLQELLLSDSSENITDLSISIKLGRSPPFLV